MTVGAVVLLAIVLAWPVPRVLPRLHALRHVPGPALLLWQAVSMAALVCGLAAAPLAMLDLARSGEDIPEPGDHLPTVLIGLALTGVLLVRLLIEGHRTGTALRRSRRQHRELVDLLGDDVDDAPADVRVLPHPTPTAYCVPGRRSRVVLTDATMRSLPAGQLNAVLAHERAHLRYRHDLVLEFFTVVHTAVPPRVRSSAGLREVKLLIEVLADHVALRTNAARDLGRALAALADGDQPEATLGAHGSSVTRLRLLADRRPRPVLAAVTLAAALLVLAAPFVLIALVVSGT
ncbi:M56 family metallopeptidase [Luteipulveratus flavus]|uniref:M56 family metallopeptidase n=1 Tax=Luteipulveratus flavus TaxID=3031728 RepID=A0ABT6C527_9MICO|nr:M56 family metallopeptidase [Luteipulveratus sp. YIM 133296]MDF8263653.1 M56 family metallopeptidase [Luteipulveratus sp. YIM 133296]